MMAAYPLIIYSWLNSSKGVAWIQLVDGMLRRIVPDYFKEFWDKQVFCTVIV